MAGQSGRRRLAAIEGGGTTWVAAIAFEDALDTLVEEIVVPTTADPASTIGQIRNWLRQREFDAVGIASFGPIDAKVGSAKYGFITSTPKPGWKDTDVVGLLGLRDEFKSKPFKFDTDVNAPALAEFRLHKKPGSCSSAYVTVGTGVGVGLVCNGQTVHGLVHPEGGHVLVARMPGDEFRGTCPFHGSCIEGMCSTGALAARVGCDADALPSLPDDHPVWDACAYYLAQLCVTLILINSPERIALGGGVMNRSCLYPKIRVQVAALLNEYIQNEAITTSQIDEYVCASFWGSKAGIVGAAFLASEALQS